MAGAATKRQHTANGATSNKARMLRNSFHSLGTTSPSRIGFDAFTTKSQGLTSNLTSSNPTTASAGATTPTNALRASFRGLRSCRNAPIHRLLRSNQRSCHVDFGPFVMLTISAIARQLNPAACKYGKRNSMGALRKTGGLNPRFEAMRSGWPCVLSSCLGVDLWVGMIRCEHDPMRGPRFAEMGWVALGRLGGLRPRVGQVRIASHSGGFNACHKLKIGKAITDFTEFRIPKG